MLNHMISTFYNPEEVIWKCHGKRRKDKDFETLWEQKKMLVTSIFSWNHSLFYHFLEPILFFWLHYFCFYKCFNLVQPKILPFGEELRKLLSFEPLHLTFVNIFGQVYRILLFGKEFRVCIVWKRLTLASSLFQSWSQLQVGLSLDFSSPFTSVIDISPYNPLVASSNLFEKSHIMFIHHAKNCMASRALFTNHSIEHSLSYSPDF